MTQTTTINLITASEQEIIDCLLVMAQELNDRNEKSDRAWTNALKSKLGEIATHRTYKVCTSGFPDRFHPEWLYDMVWYTEDQDQMLELIPLVAEFEWNKYLSQVKYDFEKLLLANSDLRLMVCQCWPDSKNEWWEFFNKAIRASKTARKEDRFLIAMYDNEMKNFEFKMIVKQ